MRVDGSNGAQGSWGDFPRLEGYDHIEMYVGNATQTAHFFCGAFGFERVASAGLESGTRDRVSVVLAQRRIRLVLTSPLTPDGPIAEHVRLHGDSVRDVAFAVSDARLAFELAVARGARPVAEPAVAEDEDGSVVRAAVAAFGDTIHSFVQRGGYAGAFLPGYSPVEPPARRARMRFSAVDHVAVGVEPGMLDELVEFYRTVLGFRHTHTENLATEYSGMNSKVVENHSGRIRFPVMEPASGRRRSQIEEYLRFHNGPGVQHVALVTNDIVGAVRMLRDNGVTFLRTPETYYDALENRVGAIGEDVLALRDLHILVDRDPWGYLMQIFSKPLHSRPTGFIEVIQRKGARGFGGGNIKALYESIEREQILRERGAGAGRD